VAIALLSVLVIPVLAAVALTIRASTTATSSSQVETALLNAVDRVNRAPNTECDYGTYAEAAVLTQGWTADEVAVQHAYLDMSLATPDWMAGAPATPACPASGPREDLIQQVLITVTSPDGKVSRTIQVVKSNV
jgi:hypothetical protein